MDVIPGLNRPFALLDFGMPKVGKTTMAASVMQSKHLDPKKVLYLDNHGSSASLFDPVPHTWTKTEPYGVYKSSDPDDLLAMIEKVAKDKNYEALGIDDLSEQTLADMDARNQRKGGDKQRMRNWGDHLDAYTHALRDLYPETSGMYVVTIGRAAWMADPTKKPDPDKPMDREGMKFQPMFKGQLGSWIPYMFDIISYHELDIVGAEIDSRMNFWPKGDIVVANRWLKAWKEKKIPKSLKDPTFDGVYDLITKVFE